MCASLLCFMSVISRQERKRYGMIQLIKKDFNLCATRQVISVHGLESLDYPRVSMLHDWLSSARQNVFDDTNALQEHARKTASMAQTCDSNSKTTQLAWICFKSMQPLTVVRQQ
jgi:hypothetical protein